jgi:hypothetical protein
MTLSLSRTGPGVVDIQRVMAWAAKHKMFLK